MPRFRLKPLELQAFRLGIEGKPTPAPAWFPTPDDDMIHLNGIYIKGALARWGDWVVRGPDGQFVVLRNEAFHLLFELMP